jgi:hypothetical protein
VDLVRNDRVFPLLKPIHANAASVRFRQPTEFVTPAVTISVFLRQNPAI